MVPRGRIIECWRGNLEFAWTKKEAEFREELREVIQEHVPERWTSLIPGEEPASEFTFEFCRTLASKDLYAPHWPKEYGGRNASPWQFIILGEELWSAGEPRGSQYYNVNWVGPAIIAAGTTEQKEYHLRRMTQGNVTWCQGFSERDAGTDLANMKTRAIRDGEEYVINGEKVWTSYAEVAEFCFLLARTDPESTRSDGISIFLVPTSTPGFSFERIPSVLDVHEYNRLTFKDVRVPVSTRLGPENEGWRVVREVLSHERIGAPRYARAALMTSRLAEIAEERGWRRRDGVASRLVAAEAACKAARLLVYQAIDARIKNRPEDLVVSLARVAIVRCERIVVGTFAPSVRGRVPRAGIDRQCTVENVDDLRPRWWKCRGAAEHGLKRAPRIREVGDVDYDLTEAQTGLLDSVGKVVDATGGIERARAVSRDDGYDHALDEQLELDVDLGGASLLDRVLIAERLAELGTATTFGTRVVLESAGISFPSGGVAVTSRFRRGPVRYAASATSVVVLDGVEGWLMQRALVSAEPVRSGLGFPCARIDKSTVEGGTPLRDPQRLQSLYKLVVSAEIAGTAVAAIAQMSQYLINRQAFGRSLSSFQALRHRLADTAVSAESTRWLVREAGFSGEARDIDLGSAYAATCAGQLAPELVQLGGARSFAKDFGLHPFLMIRLDGLRVELGGDDRLAEAVLAHGAVPS